LATSEQNSLQQRGWTFAEDLRTATRWVTLSNLLGAPEGQATLLHQLRPTELCAYNAFFPPEFLFRHIEGKIPNPSPGRAGRAINGISWADTAPNFVFSSRHPDFFQPVSAPQARASFTESPAKTVGTSASRTGSAFGRSAGRSFSQAPINVPHTGNDNIPFCFKRKGKRRRA